MKLVILTTETSHHTYFVREFLNYYPIELAIIETRQSHAPFPVKDIFEDQRDKYEQDVFFCGHTVHIADLVSTCDVDSINHPVVIEALKNIKPDIAIVFGTSKLKPELLETCPRGFINLHGGDPEEYRGLDSHLWAIYHNEFDSLITCLHRINEHLDDGDIIVQAALPLHKGMKLHELRGVNTDICIKLSVSALDMYSRFGDFVCRPQRRKGRYYSFMPATLKRICSEKFERYTEDLNESPESIKRR